MKIWPPIWARKCFEILFLCIKTIYLIVKDHFILRYLEFRLLVIIVFCVICHLFFLCCLFHVHVRRFAARFVLHLLCLFILLSQHCLGQPSHCTVLVFASFRVMRIASLAICLVHPGFWLSRFAEDLGCHFSRTCLSQSIMNRRAGRNSTNVQ